MIGGQSKWWHLIEELDFCQQALGQELIHLLLVTELFRVSARKKIVGMRGKGSSTR